MDAIDRKILKVVQDDASLSVAEIGSRVGLSSTPCWKRIQRLEADGVITKRVALVDPGKIGLGITVFVSIETGDHSQEWLAKFAETVSAMPHLQQAVIGGDGKCLSIAAASILAKVVRDRIMERLDPVWPQYGFAKHKGYGTEEHRDAVLRLGRCPQHRSMFLRKLLAARDDPAQLDFLGDAPA